jgi:hypothetical protein
MDNKLLILFELFPIFRPLALLRISFKPTPGMREVVAGVPNKATTATGIKCGIRNVDLGVFAHSGNSS